jgi:hypothetical protein
MYGLPRALVRQADGRQNSSRKARRRSDMPDRAGAASPAARDHRLKLITSPIADSSRQGWGGTGVKGDWDVRMVRIVGHGERQMQAEPSARTTTSHSKNTDAGS